VDPPQKRSGMARVVEGSHSLTCTPRVHPKTDWTIPAFAFPAKAGIHLPTLGGWKAALAWATGVVGRPGLLRDGYRGYSPFKPSRLTVLKLNF